MWVGSSCVHAANTAAPKARNTRERENVFVPLTCMITLALILRPRSGRGAYKLQLSCMQRRCAAGQDSTLKTDDELAIQPFLDFYCCSRVTEMIRRGKQL